MIGGAAPGGYAAAGTTGLMYGRSITAELMNGGCHAGGSAIG